MSREYLELAEVLASLKEGVEELFPERFWVRAEIREWSPRANGHCYLSLSQSEGGRVVAEVRAMIWKWNFPTIRDFFRQSAGEQLRPGITVLVRAQINFSEIYGISLFIDDIDPAFTVGDKALQKKKTIEKLTAGGYMQMQQELSLPPLPRRLAVISSAKAAGYGDFRHHLLDNPWGYAFQLELFEALMQGESAPAEIAGRLSQISEMPFDAVLILRGGGSESDLSCFDDYDLALAIATCPVPVVTAIGHDKDVHVADMVANISVKTPTALADLFLDAFRREDDAIDSISGRIRLGLERLVTASEKRPEQAWSRIRLGFQRRVSMMDMALQRRSSRISRGLSSRFSALQQKTEGAAHRIRFAVTGRISHEVSAVALKEALIKASDPRNILSLGYVLVTGKDNKVLKTVNRVAVGDRIGVRFSDGSLLAKVDEVYSETPAKEKSA
ncbi:MAG: exodeoxyribonuclease VII large subunit [Bacteroidales bacterium]|nr:exodeoxyribonuclease VII large subunit [Bacteroidales bacterium]